MNGEISAHSLSVALLAYLRPLRSYCGRVNSVQAIVTPSSSANRIESHPPEITQFFSDQALIVPLSGFNERYSLSLPLPDVSLG